MKYLWVKNYKSTGSDSHLYFICFWHPAPSREGELHVSNFFSSLSCAVPRTELIGDPDRYVKAGSTVIFRCVVRGALEQPSYIIWYHGSQQVYVENRRGWKVQFERDVEGDTHSSVSLKIALGNRMSITELSIKLILKALILSFNKQTFLISKVLPKLWLFWAGAYKTLRRKEIIEIDEDC